MRKSLTVSMVRLINCSLFSFIVLLSDIQLSSADHCKYICTSLHKVYITYGAGYKNKMQEHNKMISDILFTWDKMKLRNNNNRILFLKYGKKAWKKARH